MSCAIATKLWITCEQWLSSYIVTWIHGIQDWWTYNGWFDMNWEYIVTMATTPDESGNRLSRWLRKSLRRTKNAKKSRSRSGCRAALDPACISCHAAEDMPTALPRRPHELTVNGRQQVLLPEEYRSTTQPLNNNNLLRPDSKYGPVRQDPCCQQANGAPGNYNQNHMAQWQPPTDSNALGPSNKDRHSSGSEALHPNTHISSVPPPSTHPNGSLPPGHPLHTTGHTQQRDTVHKDSGKLRDRSHSRGPRQRSPSAKDGQRSASGPATAHPTSRITSTPTNAVPRTPSTLSGASPKQTPSTLKKFPDSNSPRTLSPRNIALDFPADSKPPPLPKRENTKPGLSQVKSTDPGSPSDPPTTPHNISMSSTHSGEPKFHGPTIPGSHIDAMVSPCIVDDDGPTSGYRSDSNFIISRSKHTPHRGRSRAPGLLRSDLASGYMSASEHPYITNTRAHSVVSHTSSATLRSEFLAQRSMLSGVSQHTANTLTPGEPGSDGRRTPLQMAMAGSTRANIPMRSTSPHAVISKDQVFSIYKTYKQEMQRTGAEPHQQFIIHTQSQVQPLHAQFQHQQMPLQQLPSNNASHCSNDTESELEEIMAQFHKDGALSPDATYESHSRSRRMYKRSRSHDTLQRVSHHAGSHGAQRKITHMQSGHLSDGCPPRGSRSRSEPVKPRSVSPSVIPLPKQDKQETPKGKLRKSKSYHSISPRSSQHSTDKPGDDGHVFRTRSIPSMYDPEVKGPGTLLETSSESSLSCLSSSEEEDEEEDIKKSSTPTPPAGQRRVRSHHLLQEDEQEGRQFMMRRWWSSMGGMAPPPGDVSEAIPEEDASVWSGDGEYTMFGVSRCPAGPQEPLLLMAVNLG